MIEFKREDIIKRFSIANEIYGKSLFRLNNKEYNMNGVLFVGNKAFYTNNTFMLYARTLDMPECEETEGSTIWMYNTSEEENPIRDGKDVNGVILGEVPKKEKMTSLISVKDNPLTEEETEEIQCFWEKQMTRVFNTITTNRVIFRKTDLLGELQKLYGREKRNKLAESVAIRIDREAKLLRMKPFRHKKKDEKREQKILDTIPGGELIVPFFEDDFIKKYTINDNFEKGIVLRVQELELIKAFQENEYISMSANLMAFDPKQRNKDIKDYINNNYHIVFFKGYGQEDSTIRLQIPQVTANYNPFD